MGKVATLHQQDRLDVDSCTFSHTDEASMVHMLLMFSKSLSINFNNGG